MALITAICALYSIHILFNGEEQEILVFTKSTYLESNIEFSTKRFSYN